MSFDDWLNRDQPGGRRGRQQQRGQGDFVLCRDCNSLCGQRYVPELSKLVRVGRELDSQLPPLEEVQATDLVESRVTVEIRDIKLLAVSKQMVAMALCCNAGDFKQRDTLARFVLDRDATGVPDGVRLWLALYRGTLSRRSGISGRVKFETGEQHVLTELAHPPFSYLMSFDDPSPLLPCGEVTSFAYCAVDETPQLRAELLVGYGNTVYPGDFRTAATVVRERLTG